MNHTLGALSSEKGATIRVIPRGWRGDGSRRRDEDQIVKGSRRFRRIRGMIDRDLIRDKILYVAVGEMGMAIVSNIFTKKVQPTHKS